MQSFSYCVVFLTQDAEIHNCYFKKKTFNLVFKSQPLVYMDLNIYVWIYIYIYIDLYIYLELNIYIKFKYIYIFGIKYIY